MQVTFHITVSPSSAVLHLNGRILSDEGLTAILTEVDRTIANGSHNWICNVKDLSYCNSTGLNLFVRLLTKARNAGGDCVLAEVQTGVAKLLELSKLNEIFTSYASLNEAVARFNN